MASGLKPEEKNKQQQPCKFVIGNFSSFSNFTVGGTGINKAEFQDKFDQLALYMFALFIGRVGLNYVNKYEIQFDKMSNEVFAESSKEPICKRFEELCKGHVMAAFRIARWVSLLFGFSDSATTARQALVFYYGGRLLLGGERESRLRDEHSDIKDVADIKGGMKIELDNIHFRYPTRETPVFQGLSLTISSWGEGTTGNC
ncbi:hypothetical protein C2857_005916 [Epichloe festucae Fl1]|uniref:Uncharacterized protein n=1 Tax=Epichloe festucae (strain Fl1) TaxID=877507 RepID=A0A7S9PVV9_EPIFF|nr:hypothetical protein C2857_005916 [Epichloe festucae Fl1]